MASISLTDPVAATTVTAGLHAGNNAALRTAINGGLDNTNLAAGAVLNANVNAAAAIALSKLAPGMLLGVRVLTVSGTYTPTTGTNRVYVECVGAGGQGGGTALTAGGQNAGGSGGGGGAYSASYLSSGFSVVAYVIGAGGSTSAAGNNTGQAGTDTTFNATTVVAKGGAGGTGSAANGAFPVYLNNVSAGGLASGGTGDLKMNGGMGMGAVNLALAHFAPGAGGASGLNGVGGVSSFNATGSGNNGQAPTFGGGGSGAGAAATQAAQQGGAGGAGVIRVWEFV